MIHFPVLRWGQPYKSLDVDKVVHFESGEPLAEVSQAIGGMIQRDLRRAEQGGALNPCLGISHVIRKRSNRTCKVV